MGATPSNVITSPLPWTLYKLCIKPQQQPSLLPSPHLATAKCPTLCDPMDCSLWGSSVHGIFQARVLEWVAISFSRTSSWPRDWTPVSCIAGRHFILYATREALGNNSQNLPQTAKTAVSYSQPKSPVYFNTYTTVKKSGKYLPLILSVPQEASPGLGGTLLFPLRRSMI